MNDRIKELAEQALQLVADEHTKGDTSRLNIDSYQVKDLINEKFAELIVKECIELNKQELAFNAFERMLNRYKEHFGVEE